MSYPYVNAAHFHSNGSFPQQQQQQQHQQQTQSQQRATYAQQQQQQSHHSYDTQSYGSASGSNHNHNAGSNMAYSNPVSGGIGLYAQPHHSANANAGSSNVGLLGGSDHHQHQQQQQQHPSTLNGYASSSLFPSSAYHSGNSGSQAAFEDSHRSHHGSQHQQHQHHQMTAPQSHHQHYASNQHAHAHAPQHHQQQLSSMDHGNNAGNYSHSPYPAHPYLHHQGVGASSASPSSSAMGMNNSVGGYPAGSSSGMRPKRRQVKNACINCQKACKKCDEGRPCSRCVKYGLTDTCIDSLRKERKRGIKRGPYKRRATTGSSNAPGNPNGTNGNTNGNGSGSHYDNGPSGSSVNINGGAGLGSSLYRSSTLPSASSSSTTYDNGFARTDQFRPAASPEMMSMKSTTSSAWSDAKPNVNAWSSGLMPPASTANAPLSSPSASSIDAVHSGRPLQQSQQQQQQQQAAFYNDRSSSAPLGLHAINSPSARIVNPAQSPLYGQPQQQQQQHSRGTSNSYLSSSSSNSSSTTLPFYHQRYASDNGGAGSSGSGSGSGNNAAAGFYPSSSASVTPGLTSAGSNASSANFSSPRTPGDMALPLSGGMYKTTGGGSGLTASYMHHSGASDHHNQQQQQTGAGPTRPQFALQMPPSFPRSRGGGGADMFSGPTGHSAGGGLYRGISGGSSAGGVSKAELGGEVGGFVGVGVAGAMDGHAVVQA